jgi:hypothetical protein
MSASAPETSGSSLGKKALALLVLLVAAYILLKVVIGFVTAIAGTLVIIVAIVAVVWAIRVL